MKQLVYMIAMTLAGSLGTFLVHPSWGVFVYYHFAVLRPQFLWEWSLPPGIAWSFYVAIPVMVAALMSLMGVGPGRRGWSMAHLLVILMGAWMTLTYFFAIDQAIAYPWMIENLKIYLMFAASALLLTSVKQVWYLHMMAALSIGYIAYEVNFQYFVTRYIAIAIRGYGGYDNNGAALILAIGIPLCLSAWEGLQNRLRWVFLALVPLLAHAVLMTYSRGAMLSLVVAAPLFIWRSRFRLRMAVLTTAFALIGIPLMAGKEIQERFFSIQKHEEDSSANQRLDAWKAAWRIAVQHPITGVGIRNSPTMLTQYGGMANRTVHSQMLQLAADTGFVGLGLYLLVLGSTWRSAALARRMALESGGMPEIEAMANGIQTALVVYVVGGIFLSLETFELAFLLFLIGAQLPILAREAMEQRLCNQDANDAHEASNEYVP